MNTIKHYDENDTLIGATVDGVPMVVAAMDNVIICPECGSIDVDKVHHPGTFALPECWCSRCAECLHEWGYS